ncbi:40569_t:CDS:2 [Gigaspora margarita]|uniref:40569_t:CDS:1 n=1 Tax=Gigaspora margarita TaxID=4874 RepID=A0ABN7V191_GIGMA|nr:40569_t:CDS:2 [Gigaspora margarita]
MSLNRKATGSQEISNELLKQLLLEALEKLWQIFYACIEIEDVPKMRKYNLIWPIAKANFQGKLNRTRSIMLIKHNFTQTPIQYLMHMLEDTQVNSKKFWAIAQDISKIYSREEQPSYKEYKMTKIDEAQDAID